MPAQRPIWLAERSPVLLPHPEPVPSSRLNPTESSVQIIPTAVARAVRATEWPRIAFRIQMGDNSMPDKWTRLVPLTGTGFAVIMVLSAIIGKNPPDSDASGASVITFYGANQTNQNVSNLLGALAAGVFLFFVGWLRAHLRDEGAGGLAAVGFGGGVLLAAGGASRAGFGFALADGAGKLDPGAAQALNVVFNGFYPGAVGIAVFMIATGLAIMRTAALPRWLGLAAFPIGIIALTPIPLLALLGVVVWSLVTGVVMFARGNRARNSSPELAVGVA